MNGKTDRQMYRHMNGIIDSDGQTHEWKNRHRWKDT